MRSQNTELTKKFRRLPNKVHLRKDGIGTNSWLVISEKQFSMLLKKGETELAVANKRSLLPISYWKSTKRLYVSVIRRVDYSIEEALANTDIPGYIIQMIDHYVNQELGDRFCSTKYQGSYE